MAADAGPQHKGLLPLDWWFLGAVRLAAGTLQVTLAVLLVVPRPRPRLWVVLLLLAWGTWAWIAFLWVRLPPTGSNPPTAPDLLRVFLHHWRWPEGALDLALPLVAGVLLERVWAERRARARPRPESAATCS